MKCVTAGVFVVCVCMCEDFRTSVPLKQWLQEQSSVLHFLYVSLSVSFSLSLSLPIYLYLSLSQNGNI